MADDAAGAAERARPGARARDRRLDGRHDRPDARGAPPAARCARSSRSCPTPAACRSGQPSLRAVPDPPAPRPARARGVRRAHGARLRRDRLARAAARRRGDPRRSPRGATTATTTPPARAVSSRRSSPPATAPPNCARIARADAGHPRHRRPARRALRRARHRARDPRRAADDDRRAWATTCRGRSGRRSSTAIAEHAQRATSAAPSVPPRNGLTDGSAWPRPTPAGPPTAPGLQGQDPALVLPSPLLRSPAARAQPRQRVACARSGTSIRFCGCTRTSQWWSWRHASVGTASVRVGRAACAARGSRASRAVIGPTSPSPATSRRRALRLPAPSCARSRILLDPVPILQPFHCSPTAHGHPLLSVRVGGSLSRQGDNEPRLGRLVNVVPARAGATPIRPVPTRPGRGPTDR